MIDFAHPNSGWLRLSNTTVAAKTQNGHKGCAKVRRKIAIPLDGKFAILAGQIMRRHW